MSFKAENEQTTTIFNGELWFQCVVNDTSIKWINQILFLKILKHYYPSGFAEGLDTTSHDDGFALIVEEMRRMVRIHENIAISCFSQQIEKG